MKSIVTVLGTRPEIIKLSPVLPLFDKYFRHTLIHTGQHYDENMDSVFFRELRLSLPKHYLGAGSAGAGAGAQTGMMLQRLEPIVQKIKPDYLVVLGDTNSVLAGGLVASKLDIPVVHLEAGCRSFNRSAPEEQNRVVVDHLADLLFSPDSVASSNLRREGIDPSRIHLVGNTGLDATRRIMQFASLKRVERYGVKAKGYVLATLHRAETTNDKERLREVIAGLNDVAAHVPVVFPVHPRTAKLLKRFRIRLDPRIAAIDPIGNLDFVALLRGALFAMSDSGGVQEEAAVLNTPCLILRDETEWTRLVKSGKNFLVGTSAAGIVREARKLLDSPDLLRRIAQKKAPLSFGATQKIVKELKRSSRRKC